MAENSGDIADILYSFVSATPSGTAGEKKKFNQNGDRKLVKLKTYIKYDNGTNVDKAVLTLLNKESNLYSLSIKVDKSKVFNLDSQKFKGQRFYSRASETYITQDDTTILSHMLFIGTVGNADDGNFKINKTILITNDAGKGQEKKYDDITDEEEYLNLHHIDYFSFMYDDFYKIYTEYLGNNSSTGTSEQQTSRMRIGKVPQGDNEGSQGEVSDDDLVGLDDKKKENEQPLTPEEEKTTKSSQDIAVVDRSLQASDDDDKIKPYEESLPSSDQEAPKPAEEQVPKAAAAKQAAAKPAEEPVAAPQTTAVEMGGGKKKVKKTKTKKAKKV